MKQVVSNFLCVITFSVSLCFYLFSSISQAHDYVNQQSKGQVIEKVVAYVEDEAITLTELNETYSKMKTDNPNINYDEVINMLINRLLLFKEAKKMKLDSITSSKDPIDEYIEIKIKSLIFVRDEDIQRFYDENKVEFKNIPISTVRDKIETYLIEKETNKRIKEHIEALRNSINWGYLSTN
ncbi:MAG: SurA N-terminal domain-containing protein [Thermodesulfovibrionales bacterium]|nr:SurA N-terminal domain-containing protein [Thermodesulfovibrionales bacterium]